MKILDHGARLGEPTGCFPCQTAVGPPLGGVFTATQGLRTAWNSPLDERGIVGTAMGIAYAGGRPVCEIQFADYGFNMIDLLGIYEY